MDYGALFTKLLTVSTVLGNILTLLIVFACAFAQPLYRRIMRLFGEHALWLAFVISLFAMVGSYAYGQFMGYAACILCWFQRIFMYPLPFLFGLAIWRKEKTIVPYALFLVLLGGAIALYQWIKDMLALYAHLSIGCPVVPGLPSCDRTYVLEFGYVTIPAIALNAFVLLAIVLYAALREEKFKDA